MAYAFLFSFSFLICFLKLKFRTLFVGNYLINYLATRGPELQTFVTASLIQLLCRVTKFGWFDDDRFRDVVKESMNFLSQVTYSAYIKKSVHFCVCVCLCMHLNCCVPLLLHLHVHICDV